MPISFNLLDITVSVSSRATGAAVVLAFVFVMGFILGVLI